VSAKAATKPAVLDASAVLAWLHGEPGADVVEPLLDGALLSAVNLSEVLQKAMQHGVVDAVDVTADLSAMGVKIEPFSLADAMPAARWWQQDSHLSVGDRSCLALTQRVGGQAVTADTPWRDLPDIEILLIR